MRVHGSAWVGVTKKKIKKTGWQMRRESISGNEEHWRETWCVCQNMSPDETQKEGWWSILPPCRDIAAVALYVSFCRQSALAAEAECMHQSGISSLWQCKVRSWTEALRKSFVLQICHTIVDVLLRERIARKHGSVYINAESWFIQSLRNVSHKWPVHFFTGLRHELEEIIPSERNQETL